ncbi:MAG: secondary thiamine-phosphate synthase enzyme [Nitrospirae bacterium RBG_13_39_12]|nr:MAG: secondary thiamine-phosphate synthase enzyme [Nitrospirae bacterium RBG_13_39_12]
MIFTDILEIKTKGFGDTIDITEKVKKVTEKAKIVSGLVTVFCNGSTGTITTIEFEPGVVKDLQRVLEKIVPSNVPYEHDKRWGDGNGFSHVRATLMKPSLSIPLIEQELILGTWQQVVFIDFDNRARQREIVVQIIGE